MGNTREARTGGGSGVKDPGCMFDAAKIKMLVNLRSGGGQPWKKWVERKIRRVGRRWGVVDTLQAKPTLKQRKELKRDCLVESTLRIWFELGRGMTREQVKGEVDPDGGEGKEEWREGSRVEKRGEDGWRSTGGRFER